MSAATVAALELAPNGMHVLPLHGVDVDGRCTCGEPLPSDRCNPGKHPDKSLVPHGVNGATDDVERVRAWIAARPLMNIGIAVGVGALETVRAIDIDPRNGGLATWGAFVAEHGEPPPTLTQRSGRGDGGEHRFFSFPQGLRYRGKLGPGVDLIGRGRYVVGPGSVHAATGGLYTLVSPPDVGIAAAPAWLVKLARRPPDPPAYAPPPISTPTIERARRYLARVDPAVSGQHGHDATFVVASKLVRGFRLDVTTAYALLANEWNGRCDPPWPAADLLRKVREAARAGRMSVGFLADAARRTT